MVVKSKLLFSLLFVASCAIAGERTVADYMKMSLQQLQEEVRMARNVYRETPEYKASVLANAKCREKVADLRIVVKNFSESVDQQNMEKCKQATRDLIEADREGYFAQIAQLDVEAFNKVLELVLYVEAKSLQIEAERNLQKNVQN